MREVKTAKGRILNMQALLDANQDARAISNVPMNARGDLLDEHGNIKADKGTITSAYYEDNPKATKNVSIKKSTARDPKKKIQPKVKETKETKEEPVATMDSLQGLPSDGGLDSDLSKMAAGGFEVNKNLKTRENGSQYWEIEYDDGSIQTVEVTNNES
jgi:hypothetical protein